MARAVFPPHCKQTQHDLKASSRNHQHQADAKAGNRNHPPPRAAEGQLHWVAGKVREYMKCVSPAPATYFRLQRAKSAEGRCMEACCSDDS